MKIAIIGSGIVGSITGEYFLSVGHEVVFCDNSPEILKKLESKGYKVAGKISDAISQTEACFVSVPTPTNFQTQAQDLNIIKSVAEEIGRALKEKQGHYVVSIKSTVLPGTTRNLVLPALEKNSEKKVGEFGLCAVPEFLTFIQNSWTSDKSMDRKPQSEDKIVIGQIDAKSGDVIEKIYSKHPAPKIRVNLEEAEFCKYASNFLLPAKISAFNELFLLITSMKTQGINIDSEKIADIIRLDPRLGKYGTVHGKAYGGPCFEKDPVAFRTFASNYINPRVINSVIETNDEMTKKYGIRK